MEKPQKDAAQKACCERVWSKDRWPRQYDCQKRATVERDGKHYCGTHDPEAVKRRNAKAEAKCAVRIAEMDARFAARVERERRADAFEELGRD
jgi:hypothetical protein